MRLMRDERTVFNELATLCVSPGYIHAIAWLAVRDNVIGFSGELRTQDLEHTYSKSRLVRTEISTLLGLWLKGPRAYEKPPRDTLVDYVKQTEDLLSELQSIFIRSGTDFQPIGDRSHNPFQKGKWLREPIFYGGESAYIFQYRELAVDKYTDDNAWLVANKGFDIQTARDVVTAIMELQEKKLSVWVRKLRELPPEEQTLLPGLCFTISDIERQSRLPADKIQSVVGAFTTSPDNSNDHFTSLQDFNLYNAKPIIDMGNGQFFSVQAYSLAEALYESPFYWMLSDDDYRDVAMANRGLFAERCSADFLARVFGKEHVYSNIDIYGDGGKRLGEIDVLVLFGDRAILVQAKSKRLTIDARKGNDNRLRKDFQQSIQDACDQGYRCASLLNDETVTLKAADGKEIRLTESVKVIHILCLISEHYPALSFQSRLFLEYASMEGVSPPFVLDIFTLDVMTEMLETPLYLLSYIDRRTRYHDELMANHELTILSFHLTNNLWLDDRYSGVLLDDSLSLELDRSMLVRREGLPGPRTPDGILTRFAGSSLERLLKEIETTPHAAAIEWGLLILSLDEVTFDKLNDNIDQLVARWQVDGKPHDFTVVLGHTGITVHCNTHPFSSAQRTIETHALVRKYTQRTRTWFAICVDPLNMIPRFIMSFDYPWKRDAQMEAALTEWSRQKGGLRGLRRKIGRNEPCPCGSGMKFKKCCLNN